MKKARWGWPGITKKSDCQQRKEWWGCRANGTSLNIEMASCDLTWVSTRYQSLPGALKNWLHFSLSTCTGLNSITIKVTSPRPQTPECDLILKEGFCTCNQVKSRSFWIRVGSKPNDWCPCKERWRHRGNRKKATWWQRQRLELRCH